MKKIVLTVLLLFLFLFLFSCGGGDVSGNIPFLEDINENFGDGEESFGEALECGPAYDGYFEEEINDINITLISGTAGAYTVSENTVTFTEISEETVYSISGRLKGNIVIDVGNSYKFELELCGLSLVCEDINPITVLTGDEVSIVAKKDTKNYIYDNRASVADDETLHSGAIHSEVDTEIKGKGSLTVISKSNNGIHTKDDLQIKNLTLLVCCEDNALKGNDSVEIESGDLTLIARSGDGIKTSNSNVSEKGNQRGIISILGGKVSIYAACDGIDASYDFISDGNAEIKIYTAKYSSYSEEVTASLERDEAYSLLAFGGPGGAPGGRPGRPGDNGGGMGFPGGMDGGNTDKLSYSAKGIKAANSVVLSLSKISVKSYDDSIHAGSDTVLENGEYGLGSVSVLGAELALYTNDDAMHADGELSVSSGKVYIVKSYEGLEGANVVISGGSVSIAASDDGINSTATSGEGIVLSGGTVYVYSGGDGIDSNSRTAYAGIIFSGTDAVIISTSGGNSAIDTEAGYTYTAGAVIALMPQGAMTSEAAHTFSFTSIGVAKAVNASMGEFLEIAIDGRKVTVRIPVAISGTAIILGDTGATLTSSSNSNANLDESGISWGK